MQLELKIITDSPEEMIQVINNLSSKPSEVVAVKKAVKQQPDDEKSIPSKTDEAPSLESIRALMQEKSQSGKRVEARQYLTDFGYKTLPELPKEKYAEYLAGLKVL